MTYLTKICLILTDCYKLKNLKSEEDCQDATLTAWIISNEEVDNEY